MNEKQGEQIIFLLKEMLQKMDAIEEYSSNNRDIIQDILFKLDGSTIL